MKILVACEYSQIVQEAFLSLGHYVISCDLEPGDRNLFHYRGTLEKLITQDSAWDMVIAFPPCTYLAKVQMWMCDRDEARARRRDEAVEFVRWIWSLAPKVAIENPVGYLSKNWMTPTQVLSPHLFGSHYRKEFCLWLKNLTPLVVDESSVYKPSAGEKFLNVSNHVNSRMTQSQKSKIKSRKNN